MLGFLALSVASAPRITHIPWQPFASEHARGLGGLAVGISIALWNYIGWDNPSTVQGEVKDPSRTYPRALAIALPLVTIGYFVPLLTTLGASDWTTWTEGSWPQIAASRLECRPMACNLDRTWRNDQRACTFQRAAAWLLTNSIRARRRWFAAESSGEAGCARHAADGHHCVSSFLLAFRSCRFGKLIVADVLLYSLALFLEFGALVQLRKTEPSLRGVFRIPLGRTGVAVLASLPMIVLVGVIGVSFADGEYGLPAVIGTAVAIATGPLMYRLAQRRSAS